MGIFKKKHTGGIADIIRCDEIDYLIWKWHPDGVPVGQGTRENEIRHGSRLRVKDGEVAVFVYKHRDGRMQEFIEGPFDEKLHTKNLPIISKIIGWSFEGGSPFQAEVYFINLAGVIQINYAIPYFDVFDPRFLDFGVPTAVRGTISFKIADYREFIKLHRLINFSLEDFKLQVRDAVSQYVKSFISNAPAEAGIPVIQIERQTLVISDRITANIADRFVSNFGVNVTAVDIGAIEIDKYSEGYRQLMSVTKDISIASIQTKTGVDLETMQVKAGIDLENYAETLRIQREEGQYAMHKQTQTTNLGAFQLEKQTEVGLAGAGALGQMGANGAGAVNLGGGASFNPASMMASMSVGGVVGKNIAGVMNATMAEVTSATPTPPPVPQSKYFVAVDGKPTGPFDMETLSNMAVEGKLTNNSLIWKQGMDNWVSAESIPELKKILLSPIPIQ